MEEPEEPQGPPPKTRAERAKENGGEPATASLETDNAYGYPGMTKREAFTMAAMKGIASNPDWDIDPPERIAMRATKLADATLYALEDD